MSEPVVYTVVIFRMVPSAGLTGCGPQMKAHMAAASSPQTGSEGHWRRGLLRLAVVVMLCVLILGAAIGLSLHFINTTSKTKQETQPDSSAGCQFGKCADGWRKHAGHCYFFSERNLPWSGGRQQCGLMKSDLAIVNDGNEQNFLMMAIKRKMQYAEDMFWIGLHDIEKEAEWRWVDNTSLKQSETFWLTRNEPDDWKGLNNEYPDGEDCVRMGEKNYKDQSLGGWVDTACEREFRFVCETACS